MPLVADVSLFVCVCVLLNQMLTVTTASPITLTYRLLGQSDTGGDRRARGSRPQHRSRTWPYGTAR
jgi:hypothetical protein